MYQENPPLGQQLREFVTGACKFAFWCMFVYYIGVFHLIASFFSTNIADGTDRQKGEVVISKFLEDKYTEASNSMKAHGRYSPYEYFKMLQMVRHLEDSTGAGVWQPRIMEIQQYMLQSVNAGSYTENEVIEARTWFEKHPLLKVKKAPKVVRPHICTKHICHLSSIAAFLSWLLYVYLHMLPLVFGFFLIWIWQKRDVSTLSLKSPFSFLLLILIHPVYMAIVIARKWREFFRGVAAEVELRRRKKNVFEKFSEEERAFIKAFAKSALSFKEFFQWAETLGKRRHIALVAVAAMVVCSVSFAKATDTQSDQSHITTVQNIDTSHAVSTDIDIGHVLIDVFIVETMCDLVPVPILVRTITYGKKLHFLLSSGYPQTREPIPLSY